MSNTSHVGRWMSVTIALALSALFALSAVAPTLAAGGGITQISSDPYTNKSSQHKTELEPDAYGYGTTIVAAFQVGRFASGGASNIGWATTSDGGKSWKHGFLPDTTIYAKPKGPYARVSDPAVVYDASHKLWMIVSLAIDSTGVGVAVLVSRSTDGLKWMKPVTVHKGQGSDFLDKTWITCDVMSSSPYYGHCYVEYDNFGAGLLTQMSTSTDGGATWSAPQATKDSASATGGQPLAQPNGTVIVPIDNASESSLLAFTSKDGGKTWGSTMSVTTITKHVPAGGLRAHDLISAAIDKSGKVYVAFYDCRFESGCSANDLVMTSSLNGVKWSPVVRIPVDKVGSGADHFFPAIGVDPGTSGTKAHIGITYYYYPKANCTQSTCQLDAGYISSSNGGKTWSTPLQLAGPITLTWLASTSQGYMVGEYVATPFINGKAFPVIVNATAPKGTVLNEAIYSVVSGLGS